MKLIGHIDACCGWPRTWPHLQPEHIHHHSRLKQGIFQFKTKMDAASCRHCLYPKGDWLGIRRIPHTRHPPHPKMNGQLGVWEPIAIQALQPAGQLLPVCHPANLLQASPMPLYLFHTSSCHWFGGGDWMGTVFHVEECRDGRNMPQFWQFPTVLFSQVGVHFFVHWCFEGWVDG